MDITDEEEEKQPFEYDGNCVEPASNDHTETFGINPMLTRQQIMKNLLLVSVAFLFLFTAFTSLTNLQSSLYRQEGLGTVGLSIIYASLVISCMFLPPWIIKHLGCKWTIAFSMLTYLLYMAAQFYAVWGTIIPSAIILGLGAGPLWSAKCTYVTQIGTWYAKMTNAQPDAIINRSFGLFFMIVQTGQVWGNLISALIFNQNDSTNSIDLLDKLQYCGANECPKLASNTTDIKQPELDKVYTVCGIYLAIAFVAFLIVAVFLDNINVPKEEKMVKRKSQEGTTQTSFLYPFTATFRHFWRSRYQKLLVPITIYSGLEQAFLAGDFTRSYVTCAIGIWNVGFVMICFGIVTAVGSITFGKLVQYVGQIPFFTAAFVVHLACQITLLLWLPDPRTKYVFYMVAGLWGVGDAVIQTQLNALYGYLFAENKEAAFANFRLWQSVGFIIAFAYSGFICTNIKLYICIGILTFGVIMYGVTEIILRQRPQSPTEGTTL